MWAMLCRTGEAGARLPSHPDSPRLSTLAVAAASPGPGRPHGWAVLAVLEELGSAHPVGAAAALWDPGAPQPAHAASTTPVVRRLPHSVEGLDAHARHRAMGRRRGHGRWGRGRARRPPSVGTSPFLKPGSPWGSFFEASAGGDGRRRGSSGATSARCCGKHAWAVTDGRRGVAGPAAAPRGGSGRWAPSEGATSL